MRGKIMGEQDGQRVAWFRRFSTLAGYCGVIHPLCVRFTRLRGARGDGDAAAAGTHDGCSPWPEAERLRAAHLTAAMPLPLGLMTDAHRRPS